MRIHLKTSTEPLQSGTNITADCGDEVLNAHFKFWYEGEFQPTMRQWYMCKKCFETLSIFPEGTIVRIYGMIHGHEVKETMENVD